MNQHLNDDQLLHRLYGLADLCPDDLRPEDSLNDAHVHECPECAARLKAMELRQADCSAQAREQGERISGEFLATQRRAIYARIENPTPARVHWAPALAAVTLLALGALMYLPSRPARHAVPAPAARPELNEDQLFSDVFSMEQAAEPRAAAPIRALFEDREAPEEQ